MADAPTVRTVEIKVRKMKNTVGIFPRYQPDLIFFYFVYIYDVFVGAPRNKAIDRYEVT